jgi:hypothetical protein
MRVPAEFGDEFGQLARDSGSSRRRARWRWRPVVAILVVVVGGAAIALAATGALKGGKPVRDARAPPAPSAENGSVRAKSSRMLSVRAQDPGGGLAWGMRLAVATRGLGCLEVGRVQEGNVGVVGQDHAFSDDGKFHPLQFARSATSPACAPLDRRGRLVLSVNVGDVPASGVNASGLDASGSCLAPNAHEPGGAFCPGRDERNLYYGLLGPRATTLTYTGENGAQRTLKLHSPDGAYLIVTRAVEAPGSINNEISASLDPTAPITTVTYGSGLRCNFAEPLPTVHDECRLPLGYVLRPPPHYTHAQLASPVRAVARPAGRGRWKLTVSFIAHVPITNALGEYAIRLQGPHGWYGFSSAKNIWAATRITQPLPAPLPLASGTYHGTVMFATSRTPGAPSAALATIHGTDVTVGRFTIHIRSAWEQRRSHRA